MDDQKTLTKEEILAQRRSDLVAKRDAEDDAEIVETGNRHERRRQAALEKKSATRTNQIDARRRRARKRKRRKKK